METGWSAATRDRKVSAGAVELLLFEKIRRLALGDQPMARQHSLDA